MGLKLANNAVGVLAGSITSSATTVQLRGGDGASFPALNDGGWFPATILNASGEKEIIRVTSRSGDTLTVERGQEGTLAREFDTGSVIELSLTAGVVATIMSEIEALQGGMNQLGSAAGADVGTEPDELPSNSDLPDFGSAAEADVGDEASELPTNAIVQQIISSAIAAAKEELLAKDVGLVVYRSGGFASSDEVLAYGQLLSRADYPELWAYAQGSSNLLGSDDEWVNSRGMYSPGDGSTTFRVPDLRGEFLRFWDAGRGVDGGRHFGSGQMDALQDFSGEVNIPNGNNSTGAQYFNAEGAFSHQGNSGRTGNASHGGAGGRIRISPNGVARTADETRPRNIAYLPCIKTGRMAGS